MAETPFRGPALGHLIHARGILDERVVAFTLLLEVEGDVYAILEDASRSDYIELATAAAGNGTPRGRQERLLARLGRRLHA